MAHTTESSITIDKPLEDVLAVIQDVDCYPKWADQIDQATTTAKDDQGRSAVAQFTINASVFKDQYDLAYTWPDDETARPYLVEWHLVTGKNITALDGCYELQETSATSTTVVYRLAVELGIKVPGILKRKAERSIVNNALAGLKKHVEAQS